MICGDLLAVSGELCWPSAGIFVAAYGEFFMAADKTSDQRIMSRRSDQLNYAPLTC